MSKNIARLAVTAGLTAALSFGGVMAPVTMAFAEGGSTVTFSDTDYDKTSTYKGIQIFKATVTTTAEGAMTVSGIDWGSSDVKTAVVAAIQEMDPSYSSENAQDAADWLNLNNKGANATDSTTKVNSDHVLNKIAANLKDSTGWKTTSVGDASISGLDAGYWLFLTNTLGTPEGKTTDTFTSPVFAVIDGTNPKTINPKKSVPTVDKKIVSAKGDKELDASDSHVGQSVTYNLYGTVADNYDTYGTYFYQFSDQLSKGLTLQDGAKVYLYANEAAAKADPTHQNNTGIDITNKFTPNSGSADANGSVTTTWTCDDLKQVAGVTSSSCIVLSYKAKINGKAAIGGSAGNTNTVTLEYSNNPMTSDHGTTVPDEVKSYTYGLKLNKVDLGTEKALPNAKFTIKVKAAADTALQGKYVQSDGTLGDGECKFSTGDDGAITVKGLGAGTYTVEETDAPENYDKVAPFDFTIKSKNEGEASGESSSADKYVLSAPSDQVIIGTPNDVTGDSKLEAKDGTTTNDDGTFNITVGDAKQVGLPLTGLNGVTFTWIAGGAVLCIGVAHLIRSRKQAEESEQE